MPEYSVAPVPMPPAPVVVAPLSEVGANASPPGPSLGTYSSTGGLLGAWTVHATSCKSAAMKSANGIRLGAMFNADDSNRGLDGFTFGVRTEGGTSLIKVFRLAPSLREVQLERKACTRFDVTNRLQPDGSIAADVELDCDAGDGGRVVASLHAASCR
jgi:hypothetical protein